MARLKVYLHMKRCEGLTETDKNEIRNNMIPVLENEAKIKNILKP